MAPGQSWTDLPAARGLVAALAHPPPPVVPWLWGGLCHSGHLPWIGIGGGRGASPPHGAAPTPALRGSSP